MFYKYISVIVVLFLTSCASVNDIDQSCKGKYENYIYDKNDPKISGQRSIESFNKGEEGNLRREIFKEYNRALRRNPDLEGEIVFSVQVKGDGTVSNVELLFSTINDCKFIESVLLNYRNNNYENIGEEKDISEFTRKIQLKKNR